MISDYLDIQFFKIISKELIPIGTSSISLENIAKSIQPIDHIIGTAKMMSEEKDVAAGKYWENQFRFSVVGYVDEEFVKLIRSSGAVLIYTDLRILHMYKNDVFVNAPLKSEIKSNEDISEIEFSISSTKSL